MSFLLCLGKKSKRKKVTKNEPLDRRLSEINDSKKDLHIIDTKDIQDETGSRKSSYSKKSSTSLSKKKPCLDVDRTLEENRRLQAQMETITIENKLYRTQLDQQESNISAYLEEIKRLEETNVDLKTKMTVVETEAAKTSIENQKLLQKIVGMEENQAMMSRAELQSMISQLEEAEKRTSMKPATELSGIRTNLQKTRKKTPLTQEDKQLSWRLSKTEARLSQSEDENKRLRGDLKDMLDSNMELQQMIVSDDTSYCPLKTTANHSNVVQKRQRVSVSTETETDDSDTDVSQNTLIDKLNNAERDHSKLQQDYEQLQQAYSLLLKRIEETERDVEHVKVSLNDRSDNVKDIADQYIKAAEETADKDTDDNSIEKVVTMLMVQETEHVNLRKTVHELEKCCDSLSTRIDVLYSENNRVWSENDNLLKQTKDQKNELERKTKEIETLRNEINIAKNEGKRLFDELEKTRLYQADEENTKKSRVEEIGKLEREIADLKLRLKENSLCKPVQLTKSLDLNLTTPTSLAERFRHELYEQHWVNAFDKLTKKMRREEKKTLQILGEICTEAYLFCKRVARNQMETICASLILPTAHHYRSNQVSKRNNATKSSMRQLPEDLRRRLLHYRCRPSEDFLRNAVSDFLNQIEYDRTRFLRQVSEREFSEIMPFVSACLEIVWSMSVQYPPMYLLFKVKHGHDIDRDIFDVYQSRGKRVDYVIWPAVFVEEGGSCLQKGTVYALPERS